MKGKIEELEDIRAKVEKFKGNDENFIKDLLQLLNRTTSRLNEVDDRQEINWTAKSFDILMKIRNEDISENHRNEKDLALTYLKETLDSVIIGEKNYLE